MQIMNLSKLLKRTLWFLSANVILENLPDAVLIVNKDGLIEHYNRRAKELFCFVDKSYGMYNISDIIENASGILESSIKLKKPVLATAILPEKSFYVEINAQKKFGGYCIIVRDLTLLTEELFNDDKITKFNNEKNAMLTKLEDDLKSPINSISGFSQGLIDGVGGALNEKQIKYIKIINNNAKDLYNLVDKLLTFSKVESSIYKPNYHTFDVVELIKTTSKEAEKNLETKGVAFAINSEGLQNRNIYTDFGALQEAYKNILEVSSSMTEKGYISVQILTPEDTTDIGVLLPDNKNFIHLIIRDTGIGIAEDEMKYLCEPYAQLEKGKKNFLRSLKLGIASILIKRAEGFINIRSEVMEGTRYDILLPIEKRKDE